MVEDMAKQDKNDRQKKRRKFGEGTIYWDAKAERYIGQMTIGRREDGKAIRKSVYGKDSKEVVDKISKIKKDLLLDEYVNPNKTTIAEWVILWINTYKKINIKTRTYDSYIYLTEQYINPNIGGIFIQKLENRHVQLLYNKLYDDIIANTIKKIHNVLKPALKQAVTNGLIAKNAAESIQLPTIEKKEIKVLSVSEQKRFEETAKVYRIYEAFMVCLDTGVRTSEILPLTYEDIDYKKRLLRINKNLVEVKDYKNNGTKLIVQNSGKTKSSNRIIPLTDRAFKFLVELKKERQSLSNIIFCNQAGTYMRPGSFFKSL
jgi:integrase